MSARWRMVAMSALVGLGLLPGLASSTTIDLRPLPALVASSDRVTHVRVLDSRVVADDRGVIWTAYRMQVLQELRSADAAPSFEVRQPGGRLGGRAMTAPGHADFEVGAELVLFTRRSGDGDGASWRVVNAMQGAFAVRDGRLIGATAAFPELPDDRLATLRRLVRAQVP